MIFNNQSKWNTSQRNLESEYLQLAEHMNLSTQNQNIHDPYSRK